MPIPNVTQVGPGELTLGDPAALKSFATTCVGCKIIPAVEKSDPRTVLSGDVIPGARTESATAEVKLLDDFGQTNSNTEWLWTNRGKQMPFRYTPKRGGKSIVGTVTVEPIDIAGDVGTNPENTVTFEFVGMPTFEAAGA